MVSICSWKDTAGPTVCHCQSLQLKDHMIECSYCSLGLLNISYFHLVAL